MGGIPKTRVRFRVRPKYFTIVKHTQSPQIDENFQRKNRKFSKKISKFRNFPNFFIATPNGPSYKLFGTVRQFFLNTKGSPFEIFQLFLTFSFVFLLSQIFVVLYFCYSFSHEVLHNNLGWMEKDSGKMWFSLMKLVCV